MPASVCRMAARARASRRANGSTVVERSKPCLEKCEQTSNLSGCRSRFEQRRQLSRYRPAPRRTPAALGGSRVRAPRAWTVRPGTGLRSGSDRAPPLRAGESAVVDELQVRRPQQRHEGGSREVRFDASRTRSTTAAVGSAASGSASATGTEYRQRPACLARDRDTEAAA